MFFKPYKSVQIAKKNTTKQEIDIIAKTTQNCHKQIYNIAKKVKGHLNDV